MARAGLLTLIVTNRDHQARVPESSAPAHIKTQQHYHNPPTSPSTQPSSCRT